MPDAEEIIRGDVYIGVFVDTAPPERKTKMVEMVKAPVSSPVASTVNWSNGLGPIVSLLAWIGLDVSPETLVGIIVGIQSAVSLFTIVRNTFFSPRVLAPSATVLKKI